MSDVPLEQIEGPERRGKPVSQPAEPGRDEGVTDTASAIDGPNPFAEARALMRQYLLADEGTRLGYVANVAALLHDRYHRADFRDNKTRYKAADAIMSLIFGFGESRTTGPTP